MVLNYSLTVRLERLMVNKAQGIEAQPFIIILGIKKAVFKRLNR